MRGDVGDDRRGRRRNQRRIDLVALRIENLGAGKPVSVAALEPDLDADAAVIAQCHARGREIDLMRLR